MSIARISIVLAILSVPVTALVYGAWVVEELPIMISIPFVVWVISSLVLIFSGLLLKCDICGKRPTVTWRETPKVNSKLNTNSQKFIEYFYTPELRDKKFTCVHCGSEFLLRNLNHIS
jgi:transcription elongation factor Elf1